MSDPDQEKLDSLIKNNKLGIQGPEAFGRVARTLTAIRALMLAEMPVPAKLDYEYYKFVHGYMFQDIFEWAGKDRVDLGLDMPFAKGEMVFTFPEDLKDSAKLIFDTFEDENYLKDLNVEQFAYKSAELYAKINILHPHREGNGRTNRAFMQKVAQNVNLNLFLSDVSRNKLMDATIRSVKPGTHELNDLSELKEIFWNNITINTPAEYLNAANLNPPRQIEEIKPIYEPEHFEPEIEEGLFDSAVKL